MKKSRKRRGVNQLTWDDFPVHKDADGIWHCRFCKKSLSGRKRAWCDKECERQVLLRCHWRYIRRCILRRDKYQCQLCPNKGYEVDHIIELADGGSFHEWSNLRCLCESCHKAKTLFMRTARAQAKKAGLPAQTLYNPDSIMKRHYFGEQGKIIPTLGNPVLASDGPTP